MHHVVLGMLRKKVIWNIFLFSFLPKIQYDRMIKYASGPNPRTGSNPASRYGPRGPY